MPLDKFSIVEPVSRVHKGKIVKEIFSTISFERYANKMRNAPSRVTIIPNGLNGRPDLISNFAYGTPDYWWVICLANDIIDPMEQLVAGKQIKVPIIT
jgi:hypothetical protein